LGIPVGDITRLRAYLGHLRGCQVVGLTFDQFIKVTTLF